MLKTGLVVDAGYLDHESPDYHPESPSRIRALIEMAACLQRGNMVRLEPRTAQKEEILLVHDRSHYDLLERAAGAGMFAIDADTFLSAKSFDTALLSAGGLLSVVEAIMDGNIHNGFALVRPPGHHAESNRAMGFCLFNNVAIAAAVLIARHNLERILILDWDVHHGNGTQRIFYGDPRVLYISLHQYPFYPGTGAADETGTGDGNGYTVNIPLPGGCGDREYLAAFQSIVEPVCERFNPQFVLLSAGFDAHRLDPLGGMNVTPDGFTAMARSISAVANKSAGGRFAAVLEGGYSLDALRSSVECVIGVMGEADSTGIDAVTGDIDILSGVRRIQSRFWNLSG
jgi:acetoin utilization deacetylase AcuC-like enzyme